MFRAAPAPGSTLLQRFPLTKIAHPSRGRWLPCVSPPTCNDEPPRPCCPRFPPTRTPLARRQVEARVGFPRRLWGPFRAPSRADSCEPKPLKRSPGHPGSQQPNRRVRLASPASKRSSLCESVHVRPSCLARTADPLLECSRPSRTFSVHARGPQTLASALSGSEEQRHPRRSSQPPKELFMRSANGRRAKDESLTRRLTNSGVLRPPRPGGPTPKGGSVGESGPEGPNPRRLSATNLTPLTFERASSELGARPGPPELAVSWTAASPSPLPPSSSSPRPKPGRPKPARPKPLRSKPVRRAEAQRLKPAFEARGRRTEVRHKRAETRQQGACSHEVLCLLNNLVALAPSRVLAYAPKGFTEA